MLNYFQEQRKIPEVDAVCSQLSVLKERITSGNYYEPFREYNEIKDMFYLIKQYAISINNEQLANAQIVYKNYFRLFCHLASFFDLLDKRKYKLSWDALQDCMDDVKFVGKYLALDARKELPTIYKLLEAYEDLYPFKVFASSEYIISKSHCSICGRSMQSLACPHIKGDLYYGDIAAEVIDEIKEIQAVCLVNHPEDKRCVFELSNDQRSDEEKFYKLHQFLLLGLPHLQMFSIETVMEIREDKHVIKAGRNAPCSCGSGLKFKKCCEKNLFYQHERNIVTPHNIISIA